MIKKPEFKQKKLCSWSKNTANHYNAAEPFSRSDSYGVGFVLKYPSSLSRKENSAFSSRQSTEMAVRKKHQRRLLW